jgi:hypothetical protein
LLIYRWRHSVAFWSHRPEESRSRRHPHTPRTSPRTSRSQRIQSAPDQVPRSLISMISLWILHSYHPAAFRLGRPEKSRPCRYSRTPKSLLLRVSHPERALSVPDQACRGFWTPGFMLIQLLCRFVAVWPHRLEESRSCRYSRTPKPTSANISAETRSTCVGPSFPWYMDPRLYVDIALATPGCVSSRPT